MFPSSFQEILLSSCHLLEEFLKGLGLGQANLLISTQIVLRTQPFFLCNIRLLQRGTSHFTLCLKCVFSSLSQIQCFYLPANDLNTKSASAQSVTTCLPVPPPAST